MDTPKEPQGQSNGAPRVTLISNVTLKDADRRIFYKKGDIAAAATTTTISGS